MFTKTKSVIYITKSKIKLINVTLNKKPKDNVIDEGLWMSESLENILLKFKKNIKGSARVLLSEDFVYTVNLTLTSSSMSREDVKRKAQELIPENLDETVWDFREVREVGVPTRIQIVAVAKTLFGTVSHAIAKIGIRIEAIEPLSLALARLSRKEGNAKVFVYINDGEILLTLAQKGIVLGTEHLTDLNVDAITDFIRFAKERFNIEVKDVIFCGAGQVDLAKFQNENFKAQIQNISPVISLANKEDIRGKDEEVLNLELLNLSTIHLRGVVSRHLEGAETQHLGGGEARYRLAPGEASTLPPSRWTWRWTGIIIIILIIIITVIVAGFLFFQTPQKTDQTTPKPSQTVSKPSPTIVAPAATPSAQIDFSDYSIRILNGSGREGEAARLEGILKDNGFFVAEIGNANTSDYEKTQIRHKEEVPKEVILGLDKIINTLYDFSISADLEEDAEGDIVIIIGNAIK